MTQFFWETYRPDQDFQEGSAFRRLFGQINAYLRENKVKDATISSLEIYELPDGKRLVIAKVKTK